jgi:hypothetical protein
MVTGVAPVTWPNGGDRWCANTCLSRMESIDLRGSEEPVAHQDANELSRDARGGQEHEIDDDRAPGCQARRR